MGNTIKLVSGFILFVIGILIAYETSVYNLLDILLIVGLIISIVGIILIISYFVDYNADRTTNMLKDFLSSNEENVPPFKGQSAEMPSLSNFRNKSKPSSLNPKKESKIPSLKPKSEFNGYDDPGYDDLVLDDESDELTVGEFLRDDYEDIDSKAVLNVVPQEEVNVDYDRQLEFTPNYGKPLKVTRVPKKREANYFDSEVPHFNDEYDKSNEIIKVLSEEPVIPEHAEPKPKAPEVSEPRDIKIDLNNPESLPVPKLLKSYVISEKGLVTSQEAFDELAINVNKEIMLEIPSLNDLSDRFLSHVPTIYSRVIIDEFDISDMSYMFLISSLLKQGVHIKTVPKVHTVNLITDDSHAMIISEGQNDFEYGAIYDDRTSISNIRANFEKTWNIASNLDENIIIGAIGGAS